MHQTSHGPASADLLPALYRVEATHWWTSGMRRVTHALLDGLAVAAGPVVELGCGAGVFAAELAERLPQQPVLGIDLRGEGLARTMEATQRTANLAFLQADVHRLPLQAGASPLVVALDVLDQRGVDAGLALAQSWRLLRPGGWLLVRVSAYPWLWGPHDQRFGTAQRYRAPVLRQRLVRAGFQIVRLTYANTLLLPPAVLVRLAQRMGRLPVTLELDAGPRLNRSLRAMLAWEAVWLRRRNLPAGLSLYGLARKPA